MKRSLLCLTLSLAAFCARAQSPAPPAKPAEPAPVAIDRAVGLELDNLTMSLQQLQDAVKKYEQQAAEQAKPLQERAAALNKQACEAVKLAVENCVLAKRPGKEPGTFEYTAAPKPKEPAKPAK